ncbi:class I SAM-dependent methyltransferase [Streptomyces sp. Je 1-369]|uniref:class I SAM-dependent methyltransferase n=1 Tax=Streptomyces sp. Je 1-369 TaxID=2966192 RepID=UPI002285E370|nr:class I SAM-dependent methyltransferase [Streptomyces sp. Je 1-369]WAL95193.1 methyltransferase domain-containing protein [Streptomyces sp. Je 1-369]
MTTETAETSEDSENSNDGDQPPRLTRLTFHGPLSETRAQRIVERLTASGPRTVLDLGCGWGELLLRILEAAPGATGIGVDIKGEDLDRGRAAAKERGLDGRVRFVEETAKDTARGPADVVLCLGASQALSSAAPARAAAEALRALRGLVNPGGRVVLGEGFWEREPTARELAGMWPDADAGDHLYLGDLVDAAVEAGFRPLWVETAGVDEWEEFESGYRSDVEEWLAAHPDHPEAAGTRARVDAQRASWLRGYRGVLGITYLTLAPVG